MTSTELYIQKLASLKAGDLGLLRSHAGKGLHESVDAFDLFSGLWWPLRERNARAPRRDVAWLVAKLYAFAPLLHEASKSFAAQMRHCNPTELRHRARFERNIDELLRAPLAQIEIPLRWALTELADKEYTLDWAELTDDLSIWHRESTRLKWTTQFLAEKEREPAC